MSATCARRSSAPSAQLKPIESGCECRTEFQNASGVWPDSSRPDLSVMVPDIITGTLDAALVENLGDGVERGLGVQRVEDGLDQEDVGAAVEQPARLLAIGFAQFVEGDGAEAGIGDVRRDRRGAVGRAEGAGDEARLAVFPGDAYRRGLRQPRAFEVQLVGDAATGRSRPARSRWTKTCWWRRCRRRRAGIRRGCPRSPSAASGSTGRCCRADRDGNP